MTREQADTIRTLAALLATARVWRFAFVNRAGLQCTDKEQVARNRETAESVARRVIKAQADLDNYLNKIIAESADDFR